MEFDSALAQSDLRAGEPYWRYIAPRYEGPLACGYVHEIPRIPPRNGRGERWKHCGNWFLKPDPLHVPPPDHPYWESPHLF